jgi:Ca2+-binding EF-hand superfamily protein
MTAPRLLLLTLALSAAPLDAAAPPPRPRLPEAARMFLDIALDRPMGPTSGWFGPSQSAFGWRWLAERFDADGNGAITPKEFRGPKSLFLRLDRDGDGRLTRADFDWSPRSPLAQRERLADMLFRRADRNQNGRVSAEEWQQMFEAASGGKGSLTPEDLRRMLFPPPAPPSPADRGPSRLTLLRGLFNGEIGSLYEGPAVGDPAPPFTLRTYDGKRTVSLSDFKDKKPVVLIFGSFT